MKDDLCARVRGLEGVIYRGAQEGGTPLLPFFFIMGGSAPLQILALALLFKIY